MKINNIETKEKLTLRLQRIEGQMRGVRSMLGEDRDCREIMQQLSAIHSAVQSASRVFLQEYATNCLAEMEMTPSVKDGGDQRIKQARIIQDMINLLDKAP